jgi:putative ABC transport system permease protein
VTVSATLLRETVRSVRAHALRFALTGLGIVWGVAMLTFLLAAIDGFERNFSTQLEEVAERAVFFFPGTVTKQGVGQRESRPIELKDEDLDRIARLDAVERAAPNVLIGARLMRAAGRSKLVWTYGVSADTPAIRRFLVAAGRPIAPSDVANDARVVFLGAATARRLFGGARAVGRTVHVDGIPFAVIGVSRPKNDQIIYIGPADDEIAMIPITTAERRFTRTDVLAQIVVMPRSREGSWGATRAIRELLGFHHTFAVDDHGALGDFNVEEIRQIVAPLYLGIRLFLATASLVTLLVGAVGVMNVMLVVVTERTREIGLRKAVGASNGAIFAQFLAETLAVTSLAGLAGALVGVIAVTAMGAAVGEGSVMNAPPELRAGTVLIVTALLGVVGITAGMLPAIRASRIDPATALRAA